MNIQIRAEEEGLPLLKILERRLPAAPASYLRQLIRSGKVRHAGSAISEQSRLSQGEALQLPQSSRLQQFLEESREQEIDILFETREILAVRKPAGLAVHRGAGHEEDNLARRVEILMASRGATFQTSPVHRLDLETSGPLLFGKGRRATGELGKLFMAGSVEKIYWGLASGRLQGAGRLCTAVQAKGKLKEAATDFTPLAVRGDFTLLEMRLHSGRTHQIRRQLCDAGHPLAGDRRYRGAQPLALPRIFLHCSRLSFVSPFDGRPLELECPLPADLADALRDLGFETPLNIQHH